MDGRGMQKKRKKWRKTRRMEKVKEKKEKLEHTHTSHNNFISRWLCSSALLSLYLLPTPGVSVFLRFSTPHFIVSPEFAFVLCAPICFSSFDFLLSKPFYCRLSIFISFVLLHLAYTKIFHRTTYSERTLIVVREHHRSTKNSKIAHTHILNISPTNTSGVKEHCMCLLSC